MRGGCRFKQGLLLASCVGTVPRGLAGLIDGEERKKKKNKKREEKPQLNRAGLFRQRPSPPSCFLPTDFIYST